jgi:hypothetical protein
MSSCKVTVILVGFKYNFNFHGRFWGKKKFSNIRFHEELFHANGRIDGYA